MTEETRLSAKVIAGLKDTLLRADEIHKKGGIKFVVAAQIHMHYSGPPALEATILTGSRATKAAEVLRALYAEQQIADKNNNQEQAGLFNHAEEPE